MKKHLSNEYVCLNFNIQNKDGTITRTIGLLKNIVNTVDYFINSKNVYAMAVAQIHKSSLERKRTKSKISFILI